MRYNAWAVPAKLESSDAIDRGGSGETPEVGSTFTLVPPVPRARAQFYKLHGDWRYDGGPPRCPSCSSSARRLVRFTGYRSKTDGAFHCLRCHVAWFDTDLAACYVCDQPFRIDRVVPGTNVSVGTCYHINRIGEPFCRRCRAAIGTDDKHSRRQLRRMVGLRESRA